MLEQVDTISSEISALDPPLPAGAPSRPSALLKSWGMLVQTGANGDIALAAMHRSAAENRPYRVAIVDAEMPGKDGSALARAIKSDPALSESRLLLMSPVGESAASAARRREDSMDG